jgi:hypothetical protein
MSWEEEKEKEKGMFFFHACPPHLNTHLESCVTDHMKRIEAKVERYEQHAESSCHEEGMM